MQNEIFSLILNALMAGLLLATLIYCLKLNGRIRALQDGKSELARIIREFDESTQRATQNIQELHSATTRISENIQHKIDRANYLADDLQLLIDKGSKLAPKAESAQAARAGREEPMATPLPRAKRTLADIMPSRSPEAAQKATIEDVTELHSSGEPSVRRPLRSRAEQQLMNMLGSKKTGESNG